MTNLQIQIISTPSELQALIDSSVKQAFEKLSPNFKRDETNDTPVSTKEICKFLNITEPTLIRWRQKGKIPFLRIGGRLMYQKSAVVEALSKNTRVTK
jgi:excisionase family DNA binding protein